MVRKHGGMWSQCSNKNNNQQQEKIASSFDLRTCWVGKKVTIVGNHPSKSPVIGVGVGVETVFICLVTMIIFCRRKYLELRRALIPCSIHPVLDHVVSALRRN